MRLKVKCVFEWERVSLEVEREGVSGRERVGVCVSHSTIGLKALQSLTNALI